MNGFGLLDCFARLCDRYWEGVTDIGPLSAIFTEAWRPSPTLSNIFAVGDCDFDCIKSQFALRLGSRMTMMKTSRCQNRQKPFA